MRALVLAFLCLSGCVDRSLGVDDPVLDRGPQSPQTLGCDGTAPYCIDFCGSDWLQAQAACEDGAWTCPDGLRRVDLCPPSTCWGPPASDAEVCTPDGWICQPTQNDYVSCPVFLCPECTGFADPVTIDGCTCACTNGQVGCTRAPVDPAARFFWSWDGGVVATGGGVEVLGDGTVHGWFPSVALTSAPPDFTDHLPPDDVAQLFARFAAVDRSALPHTGGGAECAVQGDVSTCASCAPASLTYSVAQQVLPEMQPVWDWFSSHARDAISVADFNPAGYCDF